jgi:hypothetical protein
MTTVHADRRLPVRERLQAAPRRALLLPVVTAVCAVALGVGYRLRDEMYLTPDAGLGYALGVAGLGAMSALLLYSLRKRARVLWSFGPLRHWFHVHMLLGVLGPAMILFHANFEARSMNAAVALWAMLIVAGSGFIGRFAYARVHLGLFGQKETLRDVMARANESRSALHRALGAVPSLADCVAEFEAQALAPSRGAFAFPLSSGRRPSGVRSSISGWCAAAGSLLQRVLALAPCTSRSASSSSSLRRSTSRSTCTECARPVSLVWSA